MSKSSETSKGSTSASHALGIQFHSQEASEQQLITQLQEKELLLILDNYEHVRITTILVEKILRGTLDVTILVTSRQRLQLQEEWVFHLTGLPYPTNYVGTVVLTEYDAIQLFTDSASRINNRFSLSQYTQEIISICQLVEGMPLPLLLASSWIETLSPPEIVAQIQQNPSFLQTQYRNFYPQ